jgi:hypothetical protein
MIRSNGIQRGIREKKAKHRAEITERVERLESFEQQR